MFYFRLIVGYSVFFLSVFSLGLLLGKLIETIFVICGYFSTRFVVPRIKHFDNTRKCICVSTLTFLIAISILSIPTEISVVNAVGIGAIIPFVMYLESVILDKPKFSVATCTEKELLDRCKQLSLSEENTNLAIEFFIKKTKQSIIADKLYINEKSVQIRKKRLKDKLNID